MTIYKSLLNIQQKLVATKDMYNSFGNYNYRSLEGILASVKPLLAEEKCILTISDKMVDVGGRVYVEASAILRNDKNDCVLVTGMAREAVTKKGMDDAQITGAASSYARKYAVNGLFATDDTKDADATSKHDKKEEKTPKPAAQANKTAADFITEVDKVAVDADTLAAWRLKAANRIRAELNTHEQNKLRGYLDDMAKVYAK